MSQLTTHILDTTLGKPAKGVVIILFEKTNGTWNELVRGETNNDGRIPDLLSNKITLPLGYYKMKFETKAYFNQLSIEAFYPWVEVIFEITTEEHYHIPLLLSPFGYSTYRGS
ncbi:5-hydroxyisourate hydrolase [Pseudarcicella hirudinis]|uniref:5-hydroxyisourate hydrolase n=1 Tax=Pseudarcicella hirudinis TaxID=1079859 RepID=A0A1I5S2G4_9BACT|nr:hydroxyisourate hydrolase [Pseudarcicella hirudinis]SFP64899.1 5-hydroxyisourate hydrolase [Pseudarcicella hirudinis]